MQVVNGGLANKGKRWSGRIGTICNRPIDAMGYEYLIHSAFNIGDGLFLASQTPNAALAALGNIPERNSVEYLSSAHQQPPTCISAVCIRIYP
jgi:hypothetical protein